MPQPQQRRIRAMSATYTTAHGNAGSLTPWARPGIEPASSWILVRFVSSEPQWELQNATSYEKYLVLKHTSHMVLNIMNNDELILCSSPELLNSKFGIYWCIL